MLGVTVVQVFQAEFGMELSRLTFLFTVLSVMACAMTKYSKFRVGAPILA